MTTNQMVKLFAKVLKDILPIKLSAKELAQIKAACSVQNKSLSFKGTMIK
jgi:hypothetical protein